MTSREFDTLVIGLGAGAPLGMWIGYKLRQAIERARAVREARVAARRASKHTPFGGLSETLQSRHHEQKARMVMVRRQQFIPIAKHVTASDAEKLTNDWREAWPEVARAAKAEAGEFQKFDDLDKERAAASAKEQRAEVVAALVGAGYKKVAAVVAVDACTLAERAGGVESWAVAAFRHALK